MKVSSFPAKDHNWRIRFVLLTAIAWACVYAVEYYIAHYRGDRDGDIITPWLVTTFRTWYVLSVATIVVVIFPDLRKRFPRLFNTLIVLGSCLVVVCLVEMSCYVLYKNMPSQKKVQQYPKGYHEKNDMLGYAPPASSDNSSSLTVDGSKVYDVTYSIDEYRRRRTPVTGLETRTRFALFFGCSFTFGEGVNGNETLPYFFAEQSRGWYMPYNYGFHGYGPQEMLARLYDNTIKDQVKEEQGIAFYLYIAKTHEERAIGNMYVFNAWGKNMPYFTLDAHFNLVRKGSFASGRPFVSRLYLLLGKSHFMKYFKIGFPVSITEKHYELTSRIITEARNEFMKKFSDSRFYVVIYPTKEKVNIIPYLQRAGIRYLDYSNLFDSSTTGYRILGDGHPTPQAYKRLADEISRDVVESVN